MAKARVSGPVRLAGVLLLFLACSATVAGALPIEATLAPVKAVLLDGTFSVKGESRAGLVAVWKPADELQAIHLPAHVYSIALLEARWKTVAGQPDQIIPQRIPGASAAETGIVLTPTIRDIIAPTITLVRGSADAKAVLTPNDEGALRLRLASEARCLLRPDDPVPVRVDDDPSMAYPSQLWDGEGLPMVSAVCKPKGIRVEGAGTLTLYGATFEVTGADAESRQAVRLRFETGASTVRNTRTPTVDDHRFASLDIVSRQDSAPWKMPVASDLWIQAARAEAVGELRIPESQGSARWGNQTFENPQGTLAPQGTFTIHGSSSTELTIRGESSNHWREVALGLGGAAAAAAGARKAAPFVQALFTRLVKDRTLEHPRRRAIMEAVRANPGLHVEALARLLGFSRQAAEYHSRILCSQGLLDCRRFGRIRALYAPGAVPVEAEKQVFRLRSDSFRAVFDVVHARPGISQRGVMERSGLSQSRVSKILAELANIGLISANRKGRGFVYAPARV